MPSARANRSRRRRDDCAPEARRLRAEGARIARLSTFPRQRAAAWPLRRRAHSHARGLRHSRAGAQTALACSTRLAPRVRRLENSPGTGMPQPTRGARFGSCDFTAHGNLDPPARRALGFRLNRWIRLVVARFRSALSRARSESQRSESDLRSQKSETEEKGKSEKRKWKIKDGRWNSRSPGDTEPDMDVGVIGVEEAAASRRATEVGAAVEPAAAAQHTDRTRRRPLRVYRWAR